MYLLTRAVFALAILVGAIASAAPAAANGPLIITGQVVNSVTSAPIAQVCVTLGPPIRCWTYTDAAGNYTVDLDAILASHGGTWDLYFVKTGYETAYSGKFVMNGPYTVPTMRMIAAAPPPPGTCAAPRTDTPTQTIYLPNITKTLGGPNGWVTPFIVQNTGTINTSLEVSFYKFSDGTCVARRTPPILAPQRSYADIPNNDSDLPNDTQFSVVVRSFGAPVVATVNQVQGSGSTAQALAYTGTSTGATTVYLPNVTRRFYGWDIPFIVQNLGTVSTTATASFRSVASPSCLSAHTYTKSLFIEPGRSKVIDPDFESAYTGAANSGLSDGCQYAVIVTSAQPIAVVANAHNEAGAPAAYSHNALSAGASTLYGAYAALNGPGGRFSPIVVQNVGTTVADATIEFTPLGGGVARSFTLAAIAAGGSRAFDPRYSNGDTAQALCSGATTTCLGSGEYSVRITSAGSIAAVVLPVSGTTATAYATALQGTARTYLPNVTRTLGGATGWTTPIVVQSTTATAATLTWFRFSDGLLVKTQSITIAPNTAQWIDPRSVAGLNDDTQYAVVVTANTGGALNAIVYEQATGGDNEMIYEGFAAP
ncbi:MAG TPA: hypothetical protein VFM06_06840 [Candidatus Limnocylindria bacterium]|nr:hypothetical protein [Candidatus Limnocylindria bacterium]